MSILSVREITGRGARLTLSPSTSLMTKYLVLTDAVHTQTEILAAVGLPIMYASHPDVAGAEAASLSIEQSPTETEPYSWIVGVEWSTGGPGSGRRQVPEDQRASNPTDRAAKFSGSFEFMEFTSFVDLDGFLITNSAMDPPDPGLTMLEMILVLKITKNLTRLPPYGEIADIQDSVNDFTYLSGPNFPGFIRDEVWLTLEGFEKVREQSHEFYPFTFVLKIRPFFNVTILSPDGTKNGVEKFGGWQPITLNQGYRYIPGGIPIGAGPITAPLDFTDGAGNKASKPQLLATNGDRLVQSDGTGRDRLPNFRHHRMKKRRDFNTLNLIP